MINNLHTLPIDQKMQMVEDLWDSIAVDQGALSLTPEQRAELDRRLDFYDVGRIKGRNANKVIADIRQRL